MVSIEEFAPIEVTLDQTHLEPLPRVRIRGFCASTSVVDVVVWCAIVIEVEGLHLFY